MNKNLNDYLKVYKNVLTDEQCDSVVAEIEPKPWVRHTFYDVKADSWIEHDKELDNWGGNISSTPILLDSIWKCLHRYIVEDIKFSWFAGWAGYSSIKYNRYNVDTRMELHCDHIHSLFPGSPKGVPILSVIGSLNDNYKGGELIMFEDEIIELNKGDIMVFPSNFMYPHQVKEVTEGTRYSFVSWSY
jgi:predicted 2-oxoglutarate/Fe(II)-dependent dioxygenase YbiX